MEGGCVGRNFQLGPGGSGRGDERVVGSGRFENRH